MIDPAPFQRTAVQLGFDASCDAATASLLGTLAASKPGGRFLELGTGICFGTAHLLVGMDQDSRLETVELDSILSAAAQSLLDFGPEISFTVSDGAAWIAAHADARYDFIFADTWPGKFSKLDETLALLAPGGIYFIDDLLPQPNWPEGHQAKVDVLRQTLLAHADLDCTSLDWATGLMMCVKRKT